MFSQITKNASRKNAFFNKPGKIIKQPFFRSSRKKIQQKSSYKKQAPQTNLRNHKKKSPTIHKRKKHHLHVQRRQKSTRIKNTTKRLFSTSGHDKQKRQGEKEVVEISIQFFAKKYFKMRTANSSHAIAGEARWGLHTTPLLYNTNSI